MFVLGRMRRPSAGVTFPSQVMDKLRVLSVFFVTANNIDSINSSVCSRSIKALEPLLQSAPCLRYSSKVSFIIIILP